MTNQCLPFISSSLKSKHRQVMSNDLFKTFEKFKQTKYKFTENDSLCVSSLYCNKYETIDSFDQKVFRETSHKYNLGEKLEDGEKNEISQYLGIKKDPNITFSIPTEVRFSNPFKSKKVLKLNSQIYRKVMSIRTSNLCDSYANEILKTSEQLSTISKMPKIRISKITKKFNHLNSFSNEYGALNTLNNDQNSNKKLSNLNPNTHNLKRFFPKIARDQMITSLSIEEGILAIPYHPPTRSQFSLCLTDEDVCFIFGGILGERLGDLWYCDLKQSQLKWNKINIKEEDSPIPRYGHSMTFGRDFIYIYGGNIGKEYYKPKEDIAIYDINKRQYYYPSVGNKTNVPFRRNHIGVSIGQNMLIHGGIDENDIMLNDMWIFDYTKNKFYNLHKKGITPPYLASHSAVLISDANRFHNQLFNIYKLPDGTIGNKSKINKLRFEGVYIFGGFDSNKKCSQKLWIVKIGKKPVDIFEPRTHGKPPPPRKLCIMTNLEELNLLVIHGGKNEQLYPEYLNDFILLDLETFNWIYPKQKDKEPTNLAEHCGFCYRNKVFILGGLNQNGFSKFDFLTLEPQLDNSNQ